MNAKQRTVLTKIFTISGTLLLWAPILFMLVTAVIGSIIGKALLFDYLMLAELFPIVALGLVLLVLASLLCKTFRKWFDWGSVAALAALTAGQIFAKESLKFASSPDAFHIKRLKNEGCGQFHLIIERSR